MLGSLSLGDRREGRGAVKGGGARGVPVGRGCGMLEARSAEERLVVLAIYPWREFWSMGERQGAASFHLSVTSFPRLGHEMHVLLPGLPRGPAEEEYHGALLHRMRTRVDFYPEAWMGTPFHHVAILFAYICWLARAVPAGLRLASRLQPDVVIGMGALGAPVARLVARARGVPNVTRLFGTELHQLSGDRIRLALRYRDIAAFKTKASYIIAHNDGSGTDKAARRFGVDMERFLHWYNGIDKDLYLNAAGGGLVRREFGIPEGDGVVLAVSRLHAEKHVDRLIGAAPAVLEAMPSTTFLVVGDGEQLEELRAVAREAGVSDRVIFTGGLPRERLPDVYDAADVFVTLSDRTNALNAVDEAMMSGVPVVALDTGETAVVVRDGENGVLIPPDELGSLPRVLVGLLSNDGDRRALGEAGRRSADERLPTVEERQVMEVEAAERAVREHRSRDGASGDRKDAA